MRFYARLVAALKLLFTVAPRASENDRLFELMERQHQQTLEVLISANATAAKMADASRAQAENFTAYLELFKVKDAPAHRALTDADEYGEELKRAGFPVDGSQEDQLAWVLRMSE
jgi:hypothetical protein